MKLINPAAISPAQLWDINFINIKFAPLTIYYPPIKHHMNNTSLTKPNHSLAVQSSPTEPHFNPEQDVLAIQLPALKPGLRITRPIGNKQHRNGSARKITKVVKTESTESAKIQFCLHAPTAQSVQLAGDFSDWEKSPVKMIRGENGIWQASVTLPPGRHSYRFLVDGEWCDDPNCAQYVPNPFGSMNAVIEVF